MKYAKNENLEISSRYPEEIKRLQRLRELHLQLVPLMGGNWNQHNLLTTQRQSLSKIFWLDYLYKQILGVPGHILEFGVQWGTSISILQNLRGMYEPFNHQRKIIGFDSFEGFVGTNSEKDGKSFEDGDYRVPQNYELLLEETLRLLEQDSPIPQKQKFELIKGDASKTVPVWAEHNPECVIAMAIFDMDIYSPTKVALSTVIPFLTKGSLLVFDELLADAFPGEARALKEILDVNNLRLKSFPHRPYAAYAIWGD